MDYLWLKALHIIAAVTWVSGVLAVAITIVAVSGRQGELEAAYRRAICDYVRRWDRRVTTPAMLLVWIAGFSLALTAHWFPQTWLLLKLVVVVLLSALHGVLSGTLRSLSASEAPGVPPPLRYAAATIVTSVVIIIVLAVIKPFYH